eukprot:TRINITY_DN1156_c0_g1_i1.p1 TRINITY_DN1156_c0_g1~~TRINITY_DN1156_c0_g1_i1.p1  ORF type:complete len:2213 (+),score=546.42 TRINITY_DN1156_c0_g1_i1:78-6716(+)
MSASASARESRGSDPSTGAAAAGGTRHASSPDQLTERARKRTMKLGLFKNKFSPSGSASAPTQAELNNAHGAATQTAEVVPVAEQPLSAESRFDAEHVSFMAATSHVMQALETSNLSVSKLNQLSNLGKFAKDIAEVRATLETKSLLASNTDCLSVVAYMVSFLQAHYESAALLPDSLYDIFIKISQDTPNTQLMEALSTLSVNNRMVLRRLSLVVNLHAARNPKVYPEVFTAWGTVTHQFLLRPQHPVAETAAVAAILRKAAMCILLHAAGHPSLIAGEELALLAEPVVCTDAEGSRSKENCELWCTNYRMFFVYPFGGGAPQPTPAVAVDPAAAVLAADVKHETANETATGSDHTAETSIEAPTNRPRQRENAAAPPPTAGDVSDEFDATAARVIEVPLWWISDMAVQQQSMQQAQQQQQVIAPSVHLKCKNFLHVTVQANNADFVRLLKFLHHAMADNSQWAYESKEASPSPFTWEDLVNDELKRMQLPTSKWRVSGSNSNYVVCATYPSRVVVPHNVRDDWLKMHSCHWEAHRFPVLCWHSTAAHTTLCRSFAGAGATLHQIMFDGVKEACGTDLVLVETGPRTEIANLTSQGYFHYDLPSAAAIGETLALLENNFAKDPDSAFGSVLAWRDQLRHFVGMAAHLCGVLQQKSAFVSHTSSEQCGRLGDTDCYLLGLTQLIADPFYRTIKGFCVLIEKDWLCFGFAFVDKKQIKNTLPVFTQFMFAVWYLTTEFPAAFEFNEDFLMFVLDSLHGNRFGTFLYNTENDRSKAKSRGTASLWSFLLHCGDFRNALYDTSRVESAGSLDLNLLSENASMWYQYYYRFNERVRKGMRHADHIVVLQDQKYRSLGQPLLGSSLNFSDCGLFYLPALVRHTASPDKRTFLSSVCVVNLKHNRLNHMPVTLCLFTNLVSLDLGFNNVEEISYQGCELLTSHLRKLTELDLSHNDLVALPYSFSGFSELKTLLLQQNKLNCFPDAVLQLPALTRLNMSFQPLQGLPDNDVPAFSDCIAALALCSTGIYEYPTTFCDFPRLTTLDLSNNSLKFLPEELGHLTALVELKAATNSFPIFPRVLLTMPALLHLDLCSNLIADVHANVSQLSNLRTLLLTQNCIQSLPIAIGQLTKLRVLTLMDNPITELTPALGGVTGLTQFAVDGSVHTRLFPQSIQQGDTAAMLQHLRTKAAESVPCCRSMMLVVGCPGVGKTALLCCLRNKLTNQATESDYEGVTVEEWRVGFDSGEGVRKEASLSVWNFGGPSAFFGCQPFLSNAASGNLTVILACDVSLPLAQARLEWWLACINCFAEKAPPVFIIGTHRDKLSKSDWDHVKNALSTKMKQQFPNVRGAFAVSCTTGTGINELRILLQQELSCLYRAGHIVQSLPMAFSMLEQLLVDTRKRRRPPAISASEYARLCAMCGVTDKKQVVQATSILTSLGDFFTVRRAASPELADFVVVDPQWLVYLISTLPSCNKQGASGAVTPATLPSPDVSPPRHHCDVVFDAAVVPISRITALWKPPFFPESVHRQLLALLFLLQVIIPVEPDDAKLVLVPSLLPPRPPPCFAEYWPEVTVDTDSSSTAATPRSGRRYVFQHLPHNLFNIFAARLVNCCAPATAAQLFWRDALLLASDSETIYVCADAPGSMLCVDMRSHFTDYGGGDDDAAARRARSDAATRLSRFIYDAVESVIADMQQVVSVYVPCSHCLAIGRPPTLFAIKDCEAAFVKGESHLYCGENNAVQLTVLVPDFALEACDAVKLDYKDLCIEKQLGEGGAAIVYKGTWKMNGQVVAVKQLKVGDCDTTTAAAPGGQNQAFSEFRREVWVMSGLKHSCIVQLVGLCLDPLCIVTEYVPYGNLFELIHDCPSKENPTGGRPLLLPVKLKIALDVACAMEFLHGTTPPQLHRDLKSPNILLCGLSETDKVVAKVADFGLAGLQHSISTRAVENPVWLAPEVMRQEQPTLKSDVYSFGVILWELATREFFFGDCSFNSVIEQKVIAGERPPLPSGPDFPEELCALVRRCWAGLPAQRPFFSDCVHSLLQIISECCPHVNTACAMPTPGSAAPTTPAGDDKSQTGEGTLWLNAEPAAASPPDAAAALASPVTPPSTSPATVAASPTLSPSSPTMSPSPPLRGRAFTPPFRPLATPRPLTPPPVPLLDELPVLVASATSCSAPLTTPPLVATATTATVVFAAPSTGGWNRAARPARERTSGLNLLTKGT